jgi:hypothetical protein
MTQADIIAYWENRGWAVEVAEHDHGNQIGIRISKGDQGHGIRAKKPTDWAELHGGLLDWAEHQKAA